MARVPPRGPSTGRRRAAGGAPTGGASDWRRATGAELARHVGGRQRPSRATAGARMAAMDRIALISDVHGNLTALEAVLADIDARGIDRIFNLGDYVGKGPRGREVVDLCRERCEVNLLGNWDDFLPDPEREFDSASLRWWLGPARPGPGGLAADAAVQPRLPAEWSAGPAVPRLGGDRAPPGPFRPRRGGVPGAVHQHPGDRRRSAARRGRVRRHPRPALRDRPRGADRLQHRQRRQLHGRPDAGLRDPRGRARQPTSRRRSRSPSSAFPTTWRPSWRCARAMGAPEFEGYEARAPATASTGAHLAEWPEADR